MRDFQGPVEIGSISTGPAFPQPHTMPASRTSYSPWEGRPPHRIKARCRLSAAPDDEPSAPYEAASPAHRHRVRCGQPWPDILEMSRTAFCNWSAKFRPWLVLPDRHRRHWQCKAGSCTRLTLMQRLIASLLALNLGHGGQAAVHTRLSDDAVDGDPVSLSTGLYWRSDDDLSALQFSPNRLVFTAGGTNRYSDFRLPSTSKSILQSETFTPSVDRRS